MQIGIFAKTFKGETPDAVLSAAAKAGYGAVQYNMACSGVGALPLHLDASVIRNVRDARMKHKVSLAAVSATYNMTHPDNAKRLHGRHSFATIASQAHAMGTNVLTVCSGSKDPTDQWRHHPDNQSPTAWREMLDEFSALIEIAERNNIFIGVEPELANVVSSAPSALKMLNTLKSDRIKIVLDPANLFEVATESERRNTIAMAIDLLGPHIIMAHAKDRNPTGEFAAAGQGVIDFDHVLSCLKRINFNGSVITHGLSEEQAPEVANFLMAKMA